jgi:hypothetical protein
LTRAKYEDEISKSGDYLRSVYRIFYRKRNSLVLDSVDLNIRYRTVDKKELFFLGRTDIIDVGSPNQFNTNRNGTCFSYLFNGEEESFIVDSLHYDFIGNNLQDLELTKISTIELPYEVEANNVLGFKLRYKHLIPEKDYCPISIFGHFKDKTELVIIYDTLTVELKLEKGLFIRDFKYPFNTDSIHVLNTGDKLDFNTKTRAYNYTDKLWSLTGITYTMIKGEDSYIFDLESPLPRVIDTNEFIEIGKLSYLCNTEGYKKILIDLEFINEDGDTLNHDLVFSFSIDIITDVAENMFKNELIIYPNPANEKINFQLPEDLNFNNLIKIYNNTGMLIFSGEFLGNNFLLKTDKFPTGIYYVKIITYKESYFKNIVIIR